jgi:hypothetical protein
MTGCPMLAEEASVRVKRRIRARRVALARLTSPIKTEDDYCRFTRPCTASLRLEDTPSPCISDLKCVTLLAIGLVSSRLQKCVLYVAALYCNVRRLIEKN